MHPILLKIGPITVYSYGTMIALGFAVSLFLICRQAIRNNMDKDLVINLVFITLLAGFTGGRILYVLLNIRYYLGNPLEIFNLSKGGLVYYGGFIAGVAAFAYYSIKKGMGFWNAADICVPYLALTQSFGRIGCFLNGCCYGKPAPADFSFGMACLRLDTAVYPTQIYASFILLLIYIVLRYWQGRRRFKGEIFLAYAMIYSTQRFFVEFLRGDNAQIFLGLTVSQVISVTVFVLGGTLFIIKDREWEKKKARSILK